MLLLAVVFFAWIGRETVVEPPVSTDVAVPAATTSIAAPRPEPATVLEPALEETDVATRQRYYDGLVLQPPLILLSRLLNASAADETTKTILLQAFTTSLARSGHDSTLSLRFVDTLLSPDYSLETKAMLAEALADSATLAGVLALLEVAEDPAAPLELRNILNEAISTVGGKRRDDGSFPTDLSPPLEAAFLRAAMNPEGNPELIAATSLAIAQVGAENGVRVLLQQIPSLRKTAETVAKVRNPAAIPALLDPLRTAFDYNDPRMEAAGKALVHIGGDAAVRPVLEWLKNAPSQAQPLAAQWFANIREPVSYDLVGSYLSSESFRSGAIMTTLQQAYDANTPVEVPRGR